jgi:hypothetical protein
VTQPSYSVFLYPRLTLSSWRSFAFTFLIGIACVVAGITAMLSDKRRGRHSSFGTLYYWCLAVVVASATSLSVVRWAENYHLFFLGTLSLMAATVARTAVRRRWRNRVRLHITGMGLSYVLMLTAFYVANGKNLPLWRELPQIVFWLLPAALGIPLIIGALLRHPLARRESAAICDALIRKPCRIPITSTPRDPPLHRPNLDRVLCHEHRRSARRRATVLEMKEGHSGSAIRSPIPSHRERLWSAMVVSVAETPGR